jgi:AcrR family transcriptional regulator
MISAAAGELAAERGFAGVSLDGVARAVGIAPAALYRHFPGKPGLAEAVLIDVVDRFGRVADDALSGGAGLRGLAGQAISVALDDPRPAGGLPARARGDQIGRAQRPGTAPAAAVGAGGRRRQPGP